MNKKLWAGYALIVSMVLPLVGLMLFMWNVRTPLWANVMISVTVALLSTKLVMFGFAMVEESQWQSWR